jgi:hypothetical protein
MSPPSALQNGSAHGYYSVLSNSHANGNAHGGNPHTITALKRWSILDKQIPGKLAIA